MKIQVNKLSITLAALAADLCLATIANASPSQITFSNDTDLALITSIAGLPGNGIAPNVTKPVSFSIVTMGCYYGGVLNNCPIEFSDKSNGERVATVYINAETATLTQAPVFYGHYANEYQVLGWEASPISQISISRKFANSSFA